MKSACILGLALTVLGLGGCKDKAAKESENASLGRVAVVNMDKIADAVGERAKIAEAIEADQRDITGKLGVLVQTANAELEEMRKKAGPNATPEQLKQIQARQAEMQQGLAQQRDQANNYLNNRRTERIKVFSDQIKPIASRLAKAEGYSVVVLPMGLLWNEESVDLTGKVIDEVNKLRAGGQFSSPPASAPAP